MNFAVFVGKTWRGSVWRYGEQTLPQRP